MPSNLAFGLLTMKKPYILCARAVSLAFGVCHELHDTPTFNSQIFGGRPTANSDLGSHSPPRCSSLSWRNESRDVRDGCKITRTERPPSVSRHKPDFEGRRSFASRFREMSRLFNQTSAKYESQSRKLAEHLPRTASSGVSSSLSLVPSLTPTAVSLSLSFLLSSVHPFQMVLHCLHQYVTKPSVLQVFVS